jgi:hypothetical protein
MPYNHTYPPLNLHTSPPFCYLLSTLFHRHAASSYRCLNIVQWLLCQGANPNIRDADGDTPLMACEDPACADALLAAGADIDAVNNDGATAFFNATWEDRGEMIDWLRDKYVMRGMDVPEVPAADSDDMGEDMEAIDESGMDDDEEGAEEGGGQAHGQSTIE